MYQKTYQNKIGTAKININKAVAGKKINCRLFYEVGSLGIDDSGSLKVLFRIVTDCGNAQFENPKKENFVKVTSSNKDVKIIPGLRSGGLYGKVYQRPWSKGFTLNFTNHYLSKGDKIYCDFKNWRMQTFCQNDFKFKIVVDPFATAKYLELPFSPVIEIVPDVPKRLVILAPNKVKKGKTFNFLIKLEDRWGNPCINKNGSFLVDSNEKIKFRSRKIEFKKGRAKLKTKVNSERTVYIKARYKNLTAISNPVAVVDKADYWHFWAELHGQSEETVGTKSIKEWFNFAKEYAFVDVACHQGNDFQITNKFWEKINQTTKLFNKKNEFIAFPGYEWSGNTYKGGDRNVLYREENLPIHRSSHALVEDYDDLDSDARTANELFQKVPLGKTIIHAHVGGRYADLSVHRGDLERNIEIHSCWGTFEWFLFDALKRGYRVGVIANSDGHTGRPGASYPANTHFNSYGGLTCILAKQLTRKSIFKALFNRRCYATTGSRIFLEARCLSGKKVLGKMGDVINVKNGRSNLAIAVNCQGTSPLDRIEVFNKDRIMYTAYPKTRSSKAKTIKLIWSGSRVKGRARNFSWKGRLKLEKNSIVSLKKINFYNRKNLLDKNKKSIIWQGNTTGGGQGLVVDLEKKTGKLFLEVNNKKFVFLVKSIGQKPKIYRMGGVDAKLEVYQTDHFDQPGNLNFSHTFKDLYKGDNPIFVKVTQKDGHMAWSSPIYLVK